MALLDPEGDAVFPGGASSSARMGRGRRRLWRMRFHRASQLAADWAKQDLNNLSLWAPVAIGIGAGVYFSLLLEPDWRFSLLLLVGFGIVSQVMPKGRRIAFPLFLIVLGFVAADWRTARVAAPILERDLGIVSVTGQLVAVEERASGRRLIVDVHFIEDIAPHKTPNRARISWRGEEFAATAGDEIVLRAGLGPPPPPAVPGGFDFARQLYFQGIGAVGFAVTPPQVQTKAQTSAPDKIAIVIENFRQRLFQRIVTSAPGEGGAILAAIVTGKRGAIPDDATAALRDTGLAHLLAISGLHMGLATGLVFFAVRLGLAAIEPIAARYPIKKWAAAAALASGFFYLVLSGGGWSARRAFIMTAIIFTAILIDRRALSLRNVAIAATLILLMTPEALFHPGFQMSFAAVTALIAGYEFASARADPHRSFSWIAKFKRYAIGLAATDTIAAVATAPYGLFHFNRVALYSLPANLFAMPVMGFWIMPWAVIGILLLPTGLDPLAWRMAASGMDVILVVAREVVSWPGAVSVTAQWPLSALLVLTFGGLWLCLSKAPWRLAGFAALPVSSFLIATTTQPTLFVANSGLNAAIVVEPGQDAADMVVYSGRRDRFSVDVWKEAIGMDAQRQPSSLMRDVFQCDDAGCVAQGVEALPRAVSFVRERTALDEDCARAELVIAFFPVSGVNYRACAAVLIDRRSVWRRGAHAIWIRDGDIVRIKTVADTRGQRPWTGAAQ